MEDFALERVNIEFTQIEFWRAPFYGTQGSLRRRAMKKYTKFQIEPIKCMYVQYTYMTTQMSRNPTSKAFTRISESRNCRKLSRCIQCTFVHARAVLDSPRRACATAFLAPRGARGVSAASTAAVCAGSSCLKQLLTIH